MTPTTVEQTVEQPVAGQPQSETPAKQLETSQPVDTAAHSESTRGGPVYRPHVDIVENEQELQVLAEMPGLREKDIEIRFENGMLTLHGKIHPRWPENQQFLLQEYGVGDFYRSFRVSEQIDNTRITAEYRGGVLTLHLPKAEEAKPRKIAVNVS